MAPKTTSSFAELRLCGDGQLRPRDGAVFGLAVHTTGSGVVEKALKAGKDPVELAVQVYKSAIANPDPNARSSGNYVGGYDGKLIQIVDEALKANHIGLSDPAGWRDKCLAGTWGGAVPLTVSALWKKAWPEFKSPVHLFPGSSANVAYIGLELVPVTKGCGAEPMKPGLLFTRAQHDLVVRLWKDIAARHGLTYQKNRLVGHEDINPANRCTSEGCWDPGYLRPSPSFDFDYVRSQITQPGVC